MEKNIYLDNSATTKPYEEVVNLMSDIALNHYGNPSSKHNIGLDAENYLKEAYDNISRVLKCEPGEILFTSGGTESDNTALIGCANAYKRRGNHIITTAIEHPAIIETTEYLKSQGFEITYLPVNGEGIVEINDLKNALTDRTILVSVMFTNNEVGSTQDITRLSAVVKEYNKDIIFHTDAVQAFGKYKIVPKKMGIDLMSVSAHKIHGPKGIGFLYIRKGVKVNPYIIGGGQQSGMRSGTENVSAIAGLGLATKLIYGNLEEEVKKMYELREFLVESVKSIDGIQINGPENGKGAPHIVSASVKGVRAEVLLHALEEKGIYVSSGSACASNKNSVSGTLKGIGLAKEYLDSTIRISMSIFNTQEELEYLVKSMREILPELRKYTRR